MNIFKKIGAAALAAALMAGTAVTASAEELVKVVTDEGDPFGYYYQWGDCKLYLGMKIPGLVIEPFSEESKAKLVDVVVPVPENDYYVRIVNFRNCPNLKTLTIMGLALDSYPSIDLVGCTSLTDIYFNGSEADWEKVMIEADDNIKKNITFHYNSTGPDGSSAPSKPSGSTGSGTATTPSTSTDKDNPDSGVGGIALAIGTAALAGAAVVISRKRK
ncbi:MAG: NPXTG-anchored protein [Oscillospiraceae bacterium]|nr:NPXTG-anchored protein [Oscillospiraceae bacterium]